MRNEKKNKSFSFLHILCAIKTFACQWRCSPFGHVWRNEYVAYSDVVHDIHSSYTSPKHFIVAYYFIMAMAGR